MIDLSPQTHEERREAREVLSAFHSGWSLIACRMSGRGPKYMGKYSETLMDHFSSPRNCGAMEQPDRTGRAGTPGQGPFMIVYVRLGSDRVVEARYQTHGCGATIAAGSLLTELIEGRSIEECLALTAEDLVRALDGVPPDKLHCPALAVAALRRALNEYRA